MIVESLPEAIPFPRPLIFLQTPRARLHGYPGSAEAYLCASSGMVD